MRVADHLSSERYVYLGSAGVVIGFVALCLLQYVMPDSVLYPGPVDPPGVQQFIGWFRGSPVHPASLNAFVWLFRSAVLWVWAFWAMLVHAGLRSGLRRPFVLLGVAGSLAVLLAVVFPTSLSHDLYAYLGYARMGPLYHLNPYKDGLASLARMGDVAAARYPTPATSVYGPLWSALTSLLALALRNRAIVAQVVALKLVQAAALLAVAVAARSVARAWDPDHAALAMVAVAFNPLLLLEGPCDGHNDIAMLALLLVGLALALRCRFVAGYLAIGASVAVKWVSAPFAPLLAIEQARALPAPKALWRTALAALLVCAPAVLAAAPYRAGLATFAGLLGTYARRAPAHGGVRWGLFVVAAAYVAAAVWVAKGPGDRLAAAWTAWSLAAVLLAIPGILPWYLSWPMAVTLTRWDRRQLLLTTACSFVALYWMLHYTALRLMP